MSQEPITLEQARSVAESLLSRRLDRIEASRPPVGVYFHGRIKEAGVPVPELIGFEPRTAWAVNTLKHILAEFDRTGRRTSGY